VTFFDPWCLKEMDFWWRRWKARFRRRCHEVRVLCCCHFNCCWSPSKNVLLSISVPTKRPTDSTGYVSRGCLLTGTNGIVGTQLSYDKSCAIPATEEIGVLVVTLGSDGIFFWQLIMLVWLIHWMGFTAHYFAQFLTDGAEVLGSSSESPAGQRWPTLYK
jgi:hypothetical protein